MIAITSILIKKGKYPYIFVHFVISSIYSSTGANRARERNDIRTVIAILINNEYSLFIPLNIDEITMQDSTMPQSFKSFIFENRRFLKE